VLDHSQMSDAALCAEVAHAAAHAERAHADLVRVIGVWNARAAWAEDGSLSAIDGGETNEDNLVLLCRRHHVATHEGGWRLTQGPDGIVTTYREQPQRHRGRRRRTRGPARAGP
jgi:hypothetical protein